MPLPASVKVSSGKLKLDTSFTVASNGYSDTRLEHAITRMQQQMRRRTGLVLPLGVTPGGATLLTRLGERSRPRLSQVRRRRIICAHNRRLPRDVTGQHDGRSDARHGNAFAAHRRRHRRLLLPAGQYPGHATLRLARPDDRRRSPLRARRRHQAQHRRYGDGEDERLPLAPQRRSGLPHREQEVPQAAREGLQRPVLHAGAGARRDRLRCRARCSRPARVRHARSHRRMDARLSRIGQRTRALRDRNAMGRLRSRRWTPRRRRPTSFSTLSSAK